MNATPHLSHNDKTANLKWLKSRMRLFIISAIVLVAIALIGLIAKWYGFAQFFTLVIPAIIVILVLYYRAITYWYEKFKHNPDEDINDSTNPYRKVFFAGVNVLGIVLLLTGFVGSFLIVSENSEGAIYKATGMMVMIIWAVIFLRYFVWALYFYNINHGLTDKDWKRIFKARQDMLKNKSTIPGSTQGPGQNPYHDQTFGLPPGTVRGMIAFTLLFGAIGLTIVSIGLRSELNPQSFFHDHYEFFKTAFLMMIAFYFGDSSLKTLSKRWGTGPQGKGGSQDDDTPNQPSPTPKPSFGPAPVNPPKPATAAPNPTKPSGPATLKSQLENTAPKAEARATPASLGTMAKEFPQIADNEMSKLLTEDDYSDARNILAKEGHDVQTAVLKAIVQVESSGAGFLDNGRAKILFEGHKFWHWLKQLGKDPQEYLFGNEDILYEKWTREHYLGGEREYERLNRAMIIDQKAAIYSASWGKFQVLGENLEHNIKSRLLSAQQEKPVENPEWYYTDVMDFYKKQSESEYYHLLDFLAFITTKTIKNNAGERKPLISFISGDDSSKFDWDKFALGYNGKGYKQNNYHTRLKQAYETFA